MIWVISYDPIYGLNFLSTWDLDFGVRPYEQLSQTNQYWFLFRQLVQSSLPHYNPLFIIQILKQVLKWTQTTLKMTSNDRLNNFLVHLLHRLARLLRIPNLFYKLLSFFSFKRFLISHGLYTQCVGSKSILLKLPPRPFCERHHFGRSQRISVLTHIGKRSGNDPGEFPETFSRYWKKFPEKPLSHDPFLGKIFFHGPWIMG